MKKLISSIAIIASFASFSGVCASQSFDDAFAELDQSIAQSSSTTQAQEFEAYKQKTRAEFEAYKAQQLAAFDDYESNMEAEFARLEQKAKDTPEAQLKSTQD